MLLDARDILQVNGTIIAGLLILLTLSGVFDKVIEPAILANRTGFVMPNEAIAIQNDPQAREYGWRLMLKLIAGISVIPFAASAYVLLDEDVIKIKDEQKLKTAKGLTQLGIAMLAVNIGILVKGP